MLSLEMIGYFSDQPASQQYPCRAWFIFTLIVVTS